MKYFLWVVLVVAVLITAGCANQNQNTSGVPPPTTTIVPVSTLPSTPPPAPVITTTPTPTPALPLQRKITDGFWCRDTTMNIGKAPTEVKECYQFFDDGTFKWGYSPGELMGRSTSCSAEMNAKCTYVLGSNGKYEVQGGYSYTLSGDALIDPHDPPYFIYTATGIP